MASGLMLSVDLVAKEEVLYAAIATCVAMASGLMLSVDLVAKEEVLYAAIAPKHPRRVDRSRRWHRKAALTRPCGRTRSAAATRNRDPTAPGLSLRRSALRQDVPKQI